MKSEAFDESSQRGIHLSVLLMLSISMAGVGIANAAYGFAEAWMLPVIYAGVAVSWYLHIEEKLEPSHRLLVYAVIGWAGFLINGVHEVSMYDISILAALEMLVYSRTDERKLIHISLVLYFFCLGVQISLLLSDRGAGADSMVASQLLSHSFFVIMIYGLSLTMMGKRKTDMEEDEGKIRKLINSRRHMEYFLSTISHKLRMPVNTAVETALDAVKAAEDEQEKENAKRVLNAGKRLTDRLDDMLDYMEIETGVLRVSETSYRLSSVINNVIRDLSLYERTDPPEILLDVDASVPKVLFGAEEQIRKLLKLTLDNAIKFTPEGGVYVRFYQDRHEQGINLCLDVQDTGKGMTRQVTERIRDTAWQADADRTRRTGGIGLGFPIINGFTSKLHGFSNVTSTPGKGTTVHISIPQGVTDDTPCIKLDHPEKIHAVFYQDPAKFPVPEVRDYYARMIVHVIRDFKLTLQRVTTSEDLKKLLAEQSFTHLFTAEEEYGKAPGFFEELSGKMHVIVVARQSFEPVRDTGVTILRKPLYSFPLAMVLRAWNAKEAQEAFSRQKW